MKSERGMAMLGVILILGVTLVISLAAYIYYYSASKLTKPIDMNQNVINDYNTISNTMEY